MKSPSRTERSDSELRICASSSNPKPISGEAPRGPHVADYGQKKKAPKKTLGIPLGPAGAPCPANEPLAPPTSPSQPQRPLLAPLEALGWLLPRPAMKLEGFPIILPCAVINGNINFT